MEACTKVHPIVSAIDDLKVIPSQTIVWVTDAKDCVQNCILVKSASGEHGSLVVVNDANLKTHILLFHYTGTTKVRRVHKTSTGLLVFDSGEFITF